MLWMIIFQMFWKFRQKWVIQLKTEFKKFHCYYHNYYVNLIENGNRVKLITRMEHYERNNTENLICQFESTL